MFYIVVLTARRAAKISRVELALDWIFRTEAEGRLATTYARRYLVKRFHRRRRYEPLPNVTYSDPRRSRHNLVRCGDRACRIDGQTPCCHIEWRARDAEALAAIRVRTIRDLIIFNLREFWQKRLIMDVPDYAVLGRMWDNHTSGGRRRAEPSGLIGHNSNPSSDEKAGRRIFAMHHNTQGLIDRLRDKIKVRRCLTRFDVQHLLPPIDVRGAVVTTHSGQLASKYSVSIQHSQRRFASESSRSIPESGSKPITTSLRVNGARKLTV